MNKRRKLLIILFIILLSTALFLSFFSAIRISREVGKGLKIPGDTYFLVRKPHPFEKVFININDEIHGVVWGSILGIFTGRGADIPWYMDEEYISSNAFFCYNTEHGVILDKEFFDNPASRK